MNEQLTIFDAEISQNLKELGMSKAASSFASDEWLIKARSIAKMLAMKFGETDSDEVQKICPRPNDVNPNATGSIFKGKEWEHIGWKKSEKIASHSRDIKIWRIK